MAKALTPFPISGKVHNFLFKMQNGKQTVQAAPTRDYNPKHGSMGYRLNKIEFAAAAMLAHNIYRQIKPNQFFQRKPGKNHDMLGPIFRPYTQNYLTAHLKKNGEYANKRACKKGSWYASEFTFYDAVKALRGLDLSNEDAPSGHVSMTPMGPQHNPTAIKVQGLEHAARAIDQHGNAKLEFRFHVRQCRVQELQFDKEEKEWSEPARQTGDRRPKQTCYNSEPTAWIPVGIIPREGFTIPIATTEWHPEDKYLTAVMVEWREIRTIGRRTIRLHKKGIARIAALHAPAEAWAAPEIKVPEACQQPRPKKTIKRISVTPQEDPKSYITQAMAMLHRHATVLPPG